MPEPLTFYNHWAIPPGSISRQDHAGIASKFRWDRSNLTDYYTNACYMNAGAVLGSTAFDTHGDSTSGDKLRDYLQAINGE